MRQDKGLFIILFNQRIMRRFIYPLFFVIIIMAGSCEGYYGKKKTTTERDSLKAKLYELIGDNPQAALSLTDSLQKERIFSAGMADCRRAQIYSELYQPRVSEIYALRAVRDGHLDEEDRNLYYFAYNLLINAARNTQNAEKELTYATEALQKAQADTSKIARAYEPDFLVAIGDCQFNLSHYKEGRESYEKAYGMYDLLLEKATSFSWFYPVFMLAVDAITNNQDNDINEVGRWLPRLDLSYKKLIGTEDIPDFVKDDAKALTLITKAKYYQLAGNGKQAAVLYDEYSKTNYAQSPVGKKAAREYFTAAGRWEETINALATADSFYVENESQYSTDYLTLVLVPRFNAQLKLDRRADALLTAHKLTAMLDSVIERTRKEETAELAIVYETKEKEAQIAQQKTELSQERALGLGILLTIVVVFFLFYARNHRLAQQRQTEANTRLAEANRLLEEQNRQLTVANARAEESSRMKTDFIQQISHEIRTPLNIISGFTQVITGSEIALDKVTRNDISQHITENTDRITDLIDKMLELAEANSQSVIERDTQATAAQIALDAVAQSAVNIAEHLTFTLQISDEAEHTLLQTHPSSATRALALLLDNAQKYTRPSDNRMPLKPSKLKESVSLTVSQEGGNMVFAVTDSGIGIPKEEAEHIFEKFVQLDKNYNGTGIGLTVARSLARRLDGDIVLDTDYSPGTRFVMTLPL